MTAAWSGLEFFFLQESESDDELGREGGEGRQRKRREERKKTPNLSLGLPLFTSFLPHQSCFFSLSLSLSLFLPSTFRHFALFPISFSLPPGLEQSDLGRPMGKGWRREKKVCSSPEEGHQFSLLPPPPPPPSEREGEEEEKKREGKEG